MGISENFLVNTKSFDPIVKALVERSDIPDKVSDELLEEMGYQNPSDLLVLHVLRGLDIIAQDKSPTDLYKKMVDPKTTNEAIAEGVINGYGELFERNPEIHKMLPGDIQDELRDYFGDKKTDLIIKYISNTFQKLVAYAGFKSIEKARNKYLQEKSVPIENGADISNQESSKPNIEDTITQDSVKSRSMEEILFGRPEGKEKSESDSKSQEEETSEPVSEDDKNKERQEEAETSPSEAEEQAHEQPSEQQDAETKEEDKQETEKERFESEIHEYTPADDIEDEDDENDGISDEKSETVPEAEKEKELQKQTYPAIKRDLDLSNRRVQKALVRRADLQYRLEYYPEALKSIGAIITYFDESDETFLKEAVQKAVVRRVEILNKLDKDEELLPALNEVIRRFSDSGNETYYRQASQAMLQKAEILEEHDYEQQDLLPLYDTIIERLEESTDPEIQNKVTGIFAKRLELLSQSAGRSEFLEALGTSIIRFKDVKRYRKYLEEAMFRKAELLEQMERNEEALDAYTAFLEEFGQTIEI